MNDRFICDAMLGDLARHLRFFGIDTLYAGELERQRGLVKPDGTMVALEDQEILDLACQQDRIVLTRDEGFSFTDPERVILVEGVNVQDYFTFLKNKLGLEFSFDQDNSRCYRCNEILVRVPKEQVKGKVKEKSYIHNDIFFQCPECQQIFWMGAHFKENDGLLNKFEGIIDND